MTTTPLDLDAIEARANAATRGPWGYFDGDDYADIAADYQQTGRGSYTSRQGIARIEADAFFDDPAHEDADEDDAADQMRANATFIVEARNDVPAMAAELRQLRAELAAAKAKIAAALDIPNRDGMGGPNEHHHDTGYNAALWDVLLAITNTATTPTA